MTANRSKDNTRCNTSDRRNSKINWRKTLLNISGIVYEALPETLKKYPDTRLGKIAEMVDDGAVSQVNFKHSLKSLRISFQ